MIASKKFRVVAFEKYLKLPSWSVSYPGNRSMHYNKSIEKQGGLRRDGRARTLTPFNGGYVSWGTTGSGKFKFRLSKTYSEDGQVLEVSVIRIPSN